MFFIDLSVDQIPFSNAEGIAAISSAEPRRNLDFGPLIAPVELLRREMNDRLGAGMGSFSLPRLISARRDLRHNSRKDD